MAAEVRAALPPLDAERALDVDGTTAELAALAGEADGHARGDRPALAWLERSSDEERRARLIEPDGARCSRPGS